MTDHFALFQEPRRPWIDPDTLKTKFLVSAAECHPDRFHQAPEQDRAAAQQRYTELNAGYLCLREPKDCLLHLLELELEAKPKAVQQLPVGTMELFVEVGETCRQVDAFLTGKAQVTSALLKVQWFEAGMKWAETLNALRQKILSKHGDLIGELTAMNSAWESAPPLGSELRRAALPLERLEEMYRALSFIARWTMQIEERLVRLNL